MTIVLFNRMVGPVPVSVVVREIHNHSIGVTEIPVETGAKITDHAYREPKKLSLEIGDANPVATFNALIRLQQSRVPFVVVSGLHVYTNMLLRNLNATRDELYSQVLNGRVELQEVIIVSTAYVASEADANSPQSTGKPGGEKSTSAARPTSERAGDAATSDRAAGTVMRGDAAEKTVPVNQNRSILSRMF